MLQRATRVEAAGRIEDTQREPQPPAVTPVERESPLDLPPSDPAEVVDALLESLNDSELADLEELDTEDIEVLARQMHLRGLRRRHPRGFLTLQA
jgi:hypothetical protein